MIPLRIRPSALRTIIAAVAVTVGGATVGHAQSATDSLPSRKQAPARTDRAASAGGLELSAEQKTKLAAITAKHADEGKAVGELFRTDPDAAMKRMVLLRTRMQAEVRTVLTPEQRTIFDRNVAEMNAQMNAHLPMAPH